MYAKSYYRGYQLCYLPAVLRKPFSVSLHFGGSYQNRLPDDNPELYSMHNIIKAKQLYGLSQDSSKPYSIHLENGKTQPFHAKHRQKHWKGCTASQQQGDASQRPWRGATLCNVTKVKTASKCGSNAEPDAQLLLEMSGGSAAPGEPAAP